MPVAYLYLHNVLVLRDLQKESTETAGDDTLAGGVGLAHMVVMDAYVIMIITWPATCLYFLPNIE